MRWLLLPFSFIFQLVITIRKLLYSIGLIKPVKVNPKVISVGNITVGGTGKTPFVIYLSRLLHKNNISVVIISSGYKRKNNITSIYNPEAENQNIFDFNHLVNDFGDEATSFILNNPQIPIVVHNKKWEAAKIATNTFNPEVLIVDDGFQHWKLKRDLDFVIIDESTNNSANYLLPYSRLRENFYALKRADLIIERDIKELNPFIIAMKNDVISINTIQLGLFTFYNSHYVKIENSAIGKSISLSSIALPMKFHKFVISKGIDIAESISFSDHFAYKSDDIEKLCKKCNQMGALSVITTEKDYVKLKCFSNIFDNYNIQLVICRIEFEITENFEILKNKLQQIGINIA